MPEINNFDNFLNNKTGTNYLMTQLAPTQEAPVQEVPNKEAQAKAVVQQNNTIPSSNTRDEFVKVKKNNGLLRKFYNFLKNTTGIGLGSKAVEKEIDKFEKGEITQDEINNTISRYKTSQENIVQSSGDLAVAATTISSYFVASNFLDKLRARDEIGALPTAIKKLKQKPPFLKNFVKNIDNILKSKTKTSIALIPILALIGGMTKLQFGQLERISSKEYSKDKSLDKKARKEDKKAKNKARIKEDFKNFATGALVGMSAPITAVVGGIVGVPAYLAGITGLRYLTSKNDGNKKSLNDFTQKLKDNAVVNTIIATAIAIPAFKHANFNKVLNTNLEKVVTKLRGKQLKLPDLPSQKSAYQELEDLLLNSESIQKSLKGNTFYNMRSEEEIIKDLTEENIFAVKFLQIKNGFSISNREGNPYRRISEALRENCPPTRTLEQAQEHINKVWGSADFKVSKLLGVGTVAETYLAKDKSGKEVCVKVLKEGITAEKIAQDKEKFIKLVAGDTPIEQLSEDKKYLIKNINDLAEGISKEVDFVNEMNAAKELKKHCKVTDVVNSINAKPGIYVMEKAPGISVKTLVDYYQYENLLKWYKNRALECPQNNSYKEMVEEFENKIAKIKSRSPEWEEFELTSSHIKKLLKNYIDLQVEQFTKIDKNGKVIHADIHPGNIFINLEALKSGKGKLFTLIDTGNTINLSKEQAKAALRITSFIKNGNTKDLSNIILDGAVLPKGLTKEDAIQKVEKDLKKYFFDSETKIESMNIDTFYALSDNILRKYNIIPSNTQLNLNKAKISAKNSFNDLCDSFFNKKYSDKFRDNMSTTETFGAVASIMKDGTDITAKMLQAKKVQETKNLFQMSPKEAWSFLRNKNMLKTNSEDYLTFEFKQDMPDPKERVLEEKLENLFN